MNETLKILIAILVVSLSVFSQTDLREASIKNMIGTVKIRKAENPNWRDAHAKMPLKEKDAIRTFVESQVEIVTSEGTLIRLEENTTMELALFKQTQNSSQTTKISILNGTVLANVKKLVNSNSKFDFETPTATASIRGTQVGFDVSSDKTSIKVFEGEVMVAPKGSSSAQSVKTNQMAIIVKGQKNATIQTLTEKDKKTIGAPDTLAKKDTVRNSGPKADTVSLNTKPDSAKALAALAVAPAQSRTDSGTVTSRLSLNVQTPAEGQKITQPSIAVMGTATPGSDVTINGNKCPVASNGSFSAKIPIPDEENQITLDIEASLSGQMQRIMRTVVYKPALTLSMTSPNNQQVFNTISIPVTGQLSPPGAELVVNETKIPVLGTGKFSAFVTIPDEEGNVTLPVEASYQGISRTETRTIVYKRLCDQNKPSISPVMMPVSVATSRVSFSVTDRTAEDEITFYKSIDGSRSTETGPPNSSFALDIEEGIHTYSVYAEDKCKNQSKVVTGPIIYLKTLPIIKVRKPASPLEVIHIPPSRPDANFNPHYTVEISVINLPENDPRFIKEVTVKNADALSQPAAQSSLIDLNSISFDIDLIRGKNHISVQVKDVNNNQIQAPYPIIIDVH